MENVEIRKVKKLKSGGIKVDVAFKTDTLGTIVIKGFRVSKGKYDAPWVQEPSYQVFGNYYRCFFWEDPQKWERLKGLLREEYSNYIENAGAEEMKNENVDPSEIPF